MIEIVMSIFKKLFRLLGFFYLAASYLLGVIFGSLKMSDLTGVYVGSLLLIFLVLGFANIQDFFRLKRRKYLDLIVDYGYFFPGLLGFYLLRQQWPNLEVIIAIMCWLSGMSLVLRELKTAKFLGEKKTLLLCSLFFLMMVNILIMNNYLGSTGFLAFVYPVIPLLVYYDKISIIRAKELLGVVSVLLYFLLLLIGLPIS